MPPGDGPTRALLLSTWILFGLVAMTLLPASGSAAPAEIDRRDRAVAADSDGDGIADDFDPDDDNDGVADDQEGAAGQGPDILAPGKDSDGDGISNVLDPDDNNNAVTDEDDPTSFPPTGGGSSGPGTGAPSTSPPRSDRTDSAGGTSAAQDGMLIRTLPETGSGFPEVQGPVLSTFAVVALLLTSIGLVIRAWQWPNGPLLR